MRKNSLSQFGASYYRDNPNYSGGYAAQEAVNRKKAQAYLNIIKKYRSSGQLLDVGCAYGYYLIEYQRAFNVKGFDISAHAIANAKKKYPTLSRFVRVADATKHWPYPDHSFDIVTAVEVIEHLPDQERFVRELSRVLKPGGIAFISTPNSAQRRLAQRFPSFFIPDRDPTHIGVQKPADFLKLFAPFFTPLDWHYHHPSIGKFWALENIGFPVRKLLGKLPIFNSEVYFVLKKPG